MDYLTNIHLFPSSSFHYFSLCFNRLLNLTFNDLILKPYYLICIISSFIFWNLCHLYIYYFIHINLSNKLKTLDVKNRIVSILHASVLFWFCFYDYLFYQIGTEKCGSQNSHFQNMILVMSCGYFIYDIVVSWWFKILDSEMLFHHTFCILGLYSGSVFNNSATEMIRSMIAAEISNPAMHMRMILKAYNLKFTKLYLLLEVYYLSSYVIARMCFGLTVVLYTLFCMENLCIIKIAGGMVWFQSFIFVGRMVKILRTRWVQRRKRKSEGIAMFWFGFNEELENLEFVKKELANKEAYIP